jgi:hypothetical protein
MPQAFAHARGQEFLSDSCESYPLTSRDETSFAKTAWLYGAPGRSGRSGAVTYRCTVFSAPVAKPSAKSETAARAAAERVRDV